ncbi:MAG TPA: hypothetical protein VHJ38_07010 [Nitrososphaeraceae archaeon]|nr:hypothetical protein [Nitrososphaeraceae archaeon]
MEISRISQKFKGKNTKRLSPYVENELWQKEELLSLIKYESFKRNKAILSLMWDSNLDLMK